jgi:hypothetical protein
MRPVRYTVRRLGERYTVWDKKVDLQVSKHCAREDAEASVRKLEAERVKDWFGALRGLHPPNQ